MFANKYNLRKPDAKNYSNITNGKFRFLFCVEIYFNNDYELITNRVENDVINSLVFNSGEFEIDKQSVTFVAESVRSSVGRASRIYREGPGSISNKIL